ncbi:MAG: hypothetical protein CMF98_00865 [Candidatus Marinimicrobia bacterium]|nr:hypothetical protein [Candidatus Neomarinimicrobiota bacterium]
MLKDIVMPQLGEGITEGTIIQWKKNIGDKIKEDEVLLEIGTDKVDSEIPSPFDGVLKEILAKPNDVFPINEVIARIDVSSLNDKSNQDEIEEKIEEKIEENEEVINEKNNILENKIIKNENNLNDNKKTFFTPLVRSIARKEGLSDDELSSISGSGQFGRVTKNDLMNYLEQKNNQTNHENSENKDFTSQNLKEDSIVNSHQLDEYVEDMDRMRQSIAKHMRDSIDTSAHVYLASECDMTNIVKFVSKNKSDFLKTEGFKLTFTPFLILAAVKTIKSLTQFNSHLNGTKIIHKKNINIGMAVALEKGLIVPVISKCDELNFLGICRKVNDLAVRSRKNQINPSELSGSTFTVTNFGIFGCVFGLPIINQPNSSILGVGAIKKRPVVIESDNLESIAIRSICNFSLGIDHRLLDGADGGKFLKYFVSTLENLDTSSLF